MLEEKVGALAGDRIVLRDPSATRTIAGAAVIDPFGPPRNRRTPRRLAEVLALATGDAEATCNLLRLESGFVETARFGLARNLRPAEVDRLLAEAGGVKLAGFGLLVETLAEARKDLVDTLKAFHETQADAPGLQPERLRVAMKKRWPAGVFRAAARSRGAGQDRRGRWGRVMRLPGHSLKLGARDEELWKKIAAVLERDRQAAARALTSPTNITCPKPTCGA